MLLIVLTFISFTVVTSETEILPPTISMQRRTERMLNTSESALIKLEYELSNITMESMSNDLKELYNKPKILKLIRDLKTFDYSKMNSEEFEKAAEELRTEIIKHAKEKENKNIYELILQSFNKMKLRKQQHLDRTEHTSTTESVITSKPSDKVVDEGGANTVTTSVTTAKVTSMTTERKRWMGEKEFDGDNDGDYHDNFIRRPDVTKYVNYLLIATLPTAAILLALLLLCCWLLRRKGCICNMFDEELCLEKESKVVTSVCPGII